MPKISPRLHEKKYIYCTLNDHKIDISDALFVFHEKEGSTYIITESHAIKHNIKFDKIWKWISLEYVSKLESIGLTALFSRHLSDHQVPCNVVAAYYHDHIFVPEDKATLAMQILERITI